MAKHLGARRVLVVFTVLALAATACSGGDDGSAPTSTTSPPSGNGSAVTGVRNAGTSGNLSVSLSQGQAYSDVTAVVPVVDGTSLNPAAIADVVDRLPSWIPDEADLSPFNRPAESLPRPRVGNTIEVAFPAPANVPPPSADTGPLEVLRFQPDGEVGIAPFVSVTFNQPMVPLGTVDEVDSSAVPVNLTPQPPGRWQWIGTRTLRFEHDPQIFDRMPMATHYTVEVPAGTTSLAGGTLSNAVEWTFVTPSPTVQWLSPQETTLPLEPVFIATFDQRVDPVAALEVISLSADGKDRAIRLATDDEIKADDVVAPRAAQAIDGTWVAFRAVDAFEPDQQIRIKVGPRVPSAEGPDSNDSFQEFRAATYAPLKVVDQSCTGREPCEAGWGMSVNFNNQLDPASLDPAEVIIDPAIPGASISVQWSQLVIQGDTAGDTTYRVTIPATLADTFGQTLGADTQINFLIRPARPLIQQVEQLLVTLDPLADTQTFPIVVRKHSELRVRVYDVNPADWQTFEDQFNRRWEGDGRLAEPSFPLLYDEVVPTGADDEARHEVPIDLGPVLKGGHGQVLVRVEGTGRFASLTQNDQNFWDNMPVEVWVQDTDIGLDMFSDSDTAVAWTTDLRTGSPLAGVDIDPLGAFAPVTTDSDGLVTFALSDRPIRPLVARAADDVAINPTWTQRYETGDQTIFYVVDDRGMYRPGETVSVKGWVRSLAFTDRLALELPRDGERIGWVARDPFGIDIGSGQISLDASGGFHLSFDIPEGANLGDAYIEFTRDAGTAFGSFNHRLQIQEFRRPEFEVSTRTESPGPYYVDQPATVAVDANYFSGGPLPGAPVEWGVTTRSTTYSPPNRGDFTFGVWTPWWIVDSFAGPYGYEGDFGRGYDYGYPEFPGPDASVETFSGTTDSSGSHYLQMDFSGDGDGLPTSVTAEASVTDVNRQVWTDSTDVLVHPAELYVGLRSARTFVKVGDPLDIEIIVTDVDGNAVAGRGLTLTAERLISQFVDGEWTDVAAETQTCDTVSAADPVTCTFSMSNGGKWNVSADVVDDAGRFSHTEMTRWVTGGDSIPNRSLDLQSVTLVPDQPTYAVGDTAEILVQSPFGEATALLTWGTAGLNQTKVVDIAVAGTTVDIPIADADVPGIHVQVELVGAAPRFADDGTPLPDVAPRPAFATGSIDLRVPPASRTLDVSVTPADGTLAPGSSTSVDVAVVDAAGSPVDGAAMLVVAVDEAILALSGYELLDPLDVFYRSSNTGFGAARGRESILLVDPQQLVDELTKSANTAAPSTTSAAADYATAESAQGAPAPAASADAFDGARNAADGDQSGRGPIGVRRNFDALAAFRPDVVTDSSGHATVSFDLPDTLTRYRVMVVAVDGVDHFGSGESTITAQLPLQVRPSAPRFLNFGDVFELPIVVQNLTDAATEVDLVIETSNLEIIGSEGRRVTVPANDRVEVRFPARTVSAGIARFRAAAVGGGNADAAVVSLPVYTPATAEAFATYGVVDDGAVIQPLAAPANVYPQFGGLEIDTSSSALQALTDAVLYLEEYQFRSADAFASRILAIAALRDVLDAFHADGMPSVAEMNATMVSDISELSSLQNFDGGFGSWRADQQSSPYRSVQAMHALVEAQSNGFAVNAQTMEMGRQYLRNIESYIPADWGPAARDMLIAYSLYVRNLDGESDRAAAQAVWRREGAALGLDAMAWIWPVVDDPGIEAEIARTLANRVTETPQAATFTTNYGEDQWLVLGSDRRTDGIVLDALIAMDPASDLIPKVVAGLIGNQVKGRWGNVQENAFILLALNDYFDTFESVTPDFVARVWLGDTYAAEHTFRGRSTDQVETLVPMSEVVSGGNADLVVQKDGAGRLYYRLGLRYAPSDLTLEPLDKGFVVQRTYEAVDDPGDVWLGADGVWHVKSGAEVRVKVTMVNDSRRTNMVLIDPLPAGLEPLNPVLANSAVPQPQPVPVEGDFGVAVDGPQFEPAFGGSPYLLPDPGMWWQGNWWDHQNLRDDRAESYASWLWAGTHEFTYVSRATTPGTFVVPPARAEEIYAPEVFGRSSTTTVIVEDPGNVG